MANTPNPVTPCHSAATDAEVYLLDVAAMTGPDREKYFGRDLPADLLKNYTKLYTELADMGIDPQWLAADGVQTAVRRNDMLIVPVFEGPLFDALNSAARAGHRKCRLFGQSYVRWVYRQQTAMPKSSVALLSAALHGCQVTFTDVGCEERRLLAEQVRAMGGRVLAGLTNETSHLVAGAVNTTDKYKVAVKYDKPVMKTSWISEAYEKSGSGDDSSFTATEAEFVRAHGWLPLEGLTITVSGFTAERDLLRTLITSNGGTFTGTMKKNQCTHLIADNTDSAKYQRASEWGMHVVSRKWLEHSVKRGACLEPSQYPVKPTVPPQTPMAGLKMPANRAVASTPTKGLLDDNLDDSMIKKLPTLEQSAIPFASYAVPNETVLSDMTQSSSARRTAESGRSSSKRRTVEQSCNVNDTTYSGGGSNTDAKLEAELASALDAFKAAPCDCLDNCSVHVMAGFELVCSCVPVHRHMVWAGCSEPALELCKQALNSAGACRVQHVHRATHVLCPTNVDQGKLTGLSSEQPCVTLAWLTACIAQRQCAPTEPHLHQASAQLQAAGEHAPAAKRSKTVSNDGQQPTAGLNASVLSQYMNVQQPAAPSTPIVSAPPPEPEPRAAVQPEPVPQTEPVPQQLHFGCGEQQAADGSQLSSATCSTPVAYLADLRFAFLLPQTFPDEDLNYLIEMVKRASGEVIEDESQPVDYLITPPFDKDRQFMSHAARHKYKQCATVVWLQRCAEEERVLPTAGDPFYRPMLHSLADADSERPLYGCVVCVSTYVGVHRGLVTHMCKVLGATPLENMSRKARKDAPPTTHLVTRFASGSKYEAARKWNIPAVNVWWLVDCVLHNEARPTQLPDYQLFVAEIDPEIDDPLGNPEHPTFIERRRKDDPWWSFAQQSTWLLPEEPTADAEPEHMVNDEQMHVSEAHDVSAVQQAVHTPVRLSSAAAAVPSASTPRITISGQPVHPQMTSTPVAVDRRVANLRLSSIGGVRGRSPVVAGSPAPSNASDVNMGSPAPPLNNTSDFLDPNKSFHPRFGGQLQWALAGLPDTPKEQQQHDPMQISHDSFNESLGTYCARKLEVAVRNTAAAPVMYGPGDKAAPPSPATTAALTGKLRQLGLDQTEFSGLPTQVRGEVLRAMHSWTPENKRRANRLIAACQTDEPQQLQVATADVLQQPAAAVLAGRTQARPNDDNVVDQPSKSFTQDVPGASPPEPDCPETAAPHNSPKLNLLDQLNSLLERDQTAAAAAQSDVPAAGDQTAAAPRTSNVAAADRLAINKLLTPDKPAAAPADVAPATGKSEKTITKSPDKSTPLANPVGWAETNDQSSEEADTANAVPDTLAPPGPHTREQLGRDFADATDDALTLGANTLANKTSADHSLVVAAAEDKHKTVPNNQQNDGEQQPPKDDQVQQQKTVERDAQAEPPQPAEAVQQQQPLRRSPRKHTPTTPAAVASPVTTAAGDRTAGRSTTPAQRVSTGTSAKRTSTTATPKRSTLDGTCEPSEEQVTTPTAAAAAAERPSVSKARVIAFTALDDVGAAAVLCCVLLRRHAMPYWLQATKQQLSAMALSLGATVSSGVPGELPCTHLIVGELSRNEKMLAAMANGHWLLHQSYISESHKQGRWLLEEQFEWGNAQLAAGRQLQKQIQKDIAAACIRWRQHVQQTGRRAFEGWSVVLCVPRDKQGSFQRLLLTGGAARVQALPDLHSFDGFTHAFVQKVPLSKATLSSMIEAGVVVYNMNYISAYLLEEQPARASKRRDTHLWPEYREAVNK